MSKAKFDDNCPGCKPIIIDPETRQVLPVEHPAMVATNKVWAGTTLAEREAFHDVTCLNSRDPEAMRLFLNVNMRIWDALKEIGDIDE